MNPTEPILNERYNRGVSGIDNGRPYRATCEECRTLWDIEQPVAHLLGAWFCPRHHDRGHVEFTELHV